MIELSITRRLSALHHRMPLLDELKGIAMILILLNHAGGVLVWNNYLHGDLGTDLFFLLSGIGIVLGYRQAGVGEFLRKRLTRLLPAYWIVFTVYLLLNQSVLQLDYTAFNIVVHYLGVHALFGDGIAFAVNDSFWFISALLGFYAFFLSCRRFLDRVDKLIFISSVLAAGIALTVFFANQGGLMGRLGFRMADFVVGMIIGHTLLTGKLKIPLTPWLGVGVCIFLYVPYTRGIVFYSSAVALAVMAAYVFALRPALEKYTPVPGSVLAFVGRHSLEIYLIHQPLMREYNRYVWGRFFGVPEPTEGLLILGIAVSIAVTLLLSVELNRFLRRFFKTRPSLDAAEAGSEPAARSLGEADYPVPAREDVGGLRR